MSKTTCLFGLCLVGFSVLGTNAQAKPAALMASLAPDAGAEWQSIDDKLDQKVEDKVEDKTEDKVDQKVEDKVENKTEEKVEQKTEDKIENKAEEKVEQKTEDKVENKTEEKVEQKTEDKVEHKAEDKVEHKAENRVEQKTDESVADKTEESAGRTDGDHQGRGEVQDGETSQASHEGKGSDSDRSDLSKVSSSVDKGLAMKAIDQRFDLARRQLDAAQRETRSLIDLNWDLARAEAKRIRDAERLAGLKDPEVIDDEYEAALALAEEARDQAEDAQEQAYDQSRETLDEAHSVAIEDADEAAQTSDDQAEAADATSDVEAATETADATSHQDAPETNTAVVGDSRDLPDVDVDQDGFAIARGEWLVLGRPDDLARIVSAGFTLRASESLSALDQVVTRVASPLQMTPEAAEMRLHDLAPEAVIDFNHLYAPQMAAHRSSANGDRPQQALKLPGAAKQVGKPIGLIDTAIAPGLPIMAGRHVEQRDFVSSSNGRPNAHGTAVASILVGEASDFEGLIPNAHLYAASVFENLPGRPDASTATTVSLVRALDWMVANKVGIVNMSLTGPKNDILQSAIARAGSLGVTVVAAIGNDGPSAKPLYPAAYADVVAVTATNHDHQVFRLANRGPQVDFAAPGVDIVHAAPSGGLQTSSGTSMAAPFVAATLLLASDGSAHVSGAALHALEKRAIDLGKAGFDTTYGNGLINPLP